MKSFLAQIAEKYYAEYGSEVSQMAFVFPNKRAGVFFNKALGEIATKPLFAPTILAINDLFYANSKLKSAKNITLKFVLYNSYKNVTKDEQTFDEFVSWCDPLLKDFNDIDKYMVDAAQVLQNIRDLEELKKIDYLTDEQIAVIEQFWGTLCDRNGHDILKNKFLDLWDKLPQIYEQFKLDLCERGIGYDGMIFREVAERAKNNIDNIHLDYKRVVFIGFNALTKTETMLLEVCQKREIGDFYFDYNSPEITLEHNIANHFINENKRFQSKFNIAENVDLKERKIELFSISSSVGQAKQVGQIVRNLKEQGTIGTNTAIVLPNESLLFPTLQALPSDTTLNITMGYPLSGTPIVTLIEQIVSLQMNKKLWKETNESTFYHKFVEAIISHPYVIEYERHNSKIPSNYSLQQLYNDIIRDKKILISPTYLLDSKKTTAANKLLEAIFVVVDDSDNFIAYLQNIIGILLEYSFDDNHIGNRYCQAVLEALNLISHNQKLFDVKIEKISTIYKALKHLISGETVPFESDIVEGVQIMGTLEARGIDFDNVIITSFNEGTFPQSTVNTPSLIPYNIRRAYELPTYEYHDAIFAYNFYRLIYRAKRVFLIYDNRTDGVNRSEISRYALQLKHILHANIGDPTIIDNKIVSTQNSIAITKDDNVWGLLQKFLTLPTENEKAHNLSASALNEFNSCSLNFYLSKVLGLQEEQQLDDGVDNSILGNIFHFAMQSIYEPYIDKEVTKEILDDLLNSQIKIEKYIVSAFEHETKNRPDVNGNYMLLAKVVEDYIKRMLRFDRDNNAPFKIIGTEYPIKCQYEFGNGRKVNIKGSIDRIHEKDGKIHIVDYKTGAKKIDFDELTDLFNADKDKGHLCQVFFYSLLYKQETNTTTTITPHIYSLSNLDANIPILGSKTNKKEIEDFTPYEQDFRELLNKNIEQIFDREQPFVQAETEKHCKFCKFKLLCNKGYNEKF